MFVALGLNDLALHSRIDGNNAREAVAMANQIVSAVFLPVPKDTALLASFGHFAGYDAGFYAYAWADAIAADMATVFETVPGRCFDEAPGMRLRREIYEPGDSRDVNIEKSSAGGDRSSRCCGSLASGVADVPKAGIEMGASHHQRPFEIERRSRRPSLPAVCDRVASISARSVEPTFLISITA